MGCVTCDHRYVVCVKQELGPFKLYFVFLGPLTNFNPALGYLKSSPTHVQSAAIIFVLSALCCLVISLINVVV